MNKKVKIIIAVVLAVLAIAGAVTGFYFGKKAKDTQKTVFDETGMIKITDENNIEFSYTCPYMSKNTKFEILNKDGAYVFFTKDSKETVIPAEITAAEYTRSESESLKTGTLTLKIKLSEKLGENEYSFVLKKDSIELKKKDYINPEMKTHFSVTSTSDGKLEANDEKYAGSKLAVPSNVSADIVKEGSKHYFIFKADINGVTTFDEIGMKNLKVLFAYGHGEKNNRTFVGIHEDENVIIKIENGSVYVKSEVKKDMLFPGDDYEYVLTKGFFTNDDKTVVSDELKGTFTYVEK